MTVASMNLDTLRFAQRQIDITSRHAKVAKAFLIHVPLWVLRLRALGALKLGIYRLKLDSLMFRGLASSVAEHRLNGGWDEIDGEAQKAIDGLGRLAENMHDLHGQVFALASKTPILQSAIREFAAAITEVYDSITILRWEFLELEASRSRIDTGYAASTAEQVDEVFARITSE